MPPVDVSSSNPIVMALGILLTQLFIVGVFAWVTVWSQIRNGRAWLTFRQGDRADWAHSSEQTAVLLVALWCLLSLAAQFSPDERQEARAITQYSLSASIITSAATGLILAVLLALPAPRDMNRFGFRTGTNIESLREGAYGFSLSILPIAASMTLVSPLRTPDSQNPLLRVLNSDAEFGLIGMVIFIAVVAAPLTEELMFRVILQGALSRLVPPRVAIPLVAWCFCSVHGLVDGVALIPLALILGIVFHRTHNYLTVVVIHAMFNATMIALQLLMVALQQTVTN